jgi:hypothetical protein
MAIQAKTTLRNGWIDAIETAVGTSGSLRIYSGSQPANCAAANSGTLIAHINLPSDWLVVSVEGVKSINNGPWQDTSADNAGTAEHWRLYSSQATMDGTTCVLQGSVGQGSGDLSLDNVTVIAGQTISISTFTFTAPNA